MTEERVGFQKGNQLWKLRPKSGRKPIWENPNEMLEACEEYFEWVISNPLWETQVISFQGQGTDHAVEKMRAMTIDGLCVFLGIGRSSWSDYKKKPDFSSVIEYVESVMHDYKLSGAAAGLLNANIIARDLKLRDTIDANVGGQEGNPIDIRLAAREMKPDEAANHYQKLMRGE